MTKKLKDILYDKWLKINTWHTGHPSDMKRFHLAIEEIGSIVGIVSYDEILDRIKKSLGASNWHRECEFYAKKAVCHY
jgi:hypothetical protein